LASGTCDYCGKPAYMPYRCRYCGGRFCPEHRLPENHECSGLRDLRQRPNWSDYAAQVQRRESIARGVAPSSRWDLQEEGRGARPSFGRLRPASSTYGEVERLRSIFVTILILVLLIAVAVKLLL